ncbi:MAG: DUF554 domain-containing protein [Coriobacteriales bacterium]|nr:DUF554 domain-containing protein [Coriobacteriales bacterium]
MTGVGLNILTVIIGTAIGVLFGRVIPERFRQVVFYAIGSCTIAFGAIMAVSGFSDLSATSVGSLAAIVLVLSLVLGSLTGELLRIEQRLEGLGSLMHRLLPRGGPKVGSGTARASEKRTEIGARGNAPSDASASSTFAEGFMTASIFFCAGAMTIMGSIQAGLGDPSTLYLKSTLDGISSIALSTALGIGVGFSAVTILVVQGGIALGASALSALITPAIMAAINLVGGAMLVALGIEILGIKKLRVGNMLPALIYAIILAAIIGQ